MVDREVLIEVSARHVHLTKEQVEILFGEGHELTPKKKLSQPGHFLAEERVNIIGAKKTYKDVAILGPIRENAQVELSFSDCYSLGVEGMLRNSRELKGTHGIKISTEQGEIELAEGVIVAHRHIPMTPQDSIRLGVKDGDLVNVKVDNGLGRNLIFSDVLVRVDKNSALSMHIDTDEANAALISRNMRGILI